MKVKSWIFGWIIIGLFVGCTTPEEIILVNIPLDDGFELLSQYSFFKGAMNNVVPNTSGGVVPYDLNTPLFSDYANKKRMVYIPEGGVISFDTSDVLSFPEGSVIIKHFFFDNPDGSIKHMETRLLIRRTDKWQPEIYEWNTEQTEATRTLVGGTRNINVLVNDNEETFNYLIPNQNQCKNCHSKNGEIEIIGPEIANLNKNFLYDEGSANQLEKWVEYGILESPTITNIPSWPAYDDPTQDLDKRARAYLSVNCASCHRLEGSAANSGFYLEYDNTDSLSLGIYKGPVAAGAGSGGFNYVIDPGKSASSILLFRMLTSEVDERMPEIGRELIHIEGAELIREWIDSL